MAAVPAQDFVRRFERFDRIELQNTAVWMPRPDTPPRPRYVPRPRLHEQAMAAWLAADGQPLNFRLYGPPGSGKNTLVYQLAHELDRGLWIINGHEGLTAEDITCTLKAAPGGGFDYVASPILAAMYYGGLCFFDEIGKAPASALSPLASVLDERRTLKATLAGLDVPAHPEFRFCAALNEDEEQSGALPEFLRERLDPGFRVGYPKIEALERILRLHLAGAEELWFSVFLRRFDDGLSPREACAVLGYAYRLHLVRQDVPLTRRLAQRYIKRALHDCRGGEAPVETMDEALS